MKSYEWHKIGRIFCPQDVTGRYWLNSFAQAPSILLTDDVLRIYFSCRPAPDKNKNYVSYSAFADFDPENFQVLRVAEKPVIPLGDIGTFDEYGVYPISVIRDNQRILAYYAGWTRCESVPFNVAIGCAESFDGGVTFQKLGPGPVLGYSLNEPFVVSGPKIRKYDDLWFLFYISGRKWKVVNNRPEPVYKIRMAQSSDGLNWSKLNKDLIESRIEPDEAQASPDVFFANNKYHMFFCYRYSENYRSHEFGYRIGYAWSTNLTDWHREDHRTGITVSDNGWDSQMISYPHVFLLQNRIYMAYLGNEVGREGFGLARLDGDLY